MIGKTVSHYRIVDRVGSGGMGEVYRANDLTLSRQVALKFLSRDLLPDPHHTERFLREAQAASALDHPNICTIFEIGTTDDGQAYIAMPYYEGHTLRSLLARGPLSPARAVAYAVAAADGLAKAHRKGILHRDIKPDNIMITGDDILKILDFGVAKLQGRSDITRMGTVMGTVAYMSPEQVTGREVDARSDVFSLGATLYECVTGRSPFRAENPASAIHKILNEDPPSPRSVRPEVPAALDRVILTALAKKPRDRFGSMAEFRQALSAVRRESESAVTAPLTGTAAARRRRPGGRRRWAALVLVIPVVLVALNRHAIWNRLGLGGSGSGEGLVVLPFQDLTRNAASGPFAAGLGPELSARLARLAARVPGRWVVPSRRVETGDTPESAKGRFGVSAVVTGTVQRVESHYELECRLLDAGNGRVLSHFRLSTADGTWPRELDPRLETLVHGTFGRAGIDTTDAAMPGAAAFEAYLSGLGHLALDEPDTVAGPAALVDLDRAIAADSGFADAYVARARALYRGGADGQDTTWADDALHACRRALEIDPSQADAFLWTGRTRAEIGDKEGGIEPLERAAALTPRDPDLPHWLGRAYEGLHRYELAESTYLRARTVNPGYWGTWEDLGYLYFQRLGRNADAEKAFEKVVELVPGQAKTYLYLGGLAYAREDWDRAIPMFEKSFELAPSPGACANLGLLYYFQGDFQKAAKYDALAREYESTYLTVGNLAYACSWVPEERERVVSLFREAAGLAETELEESPQDAPLLSNLAGYYAFTDTAAAARTMEAALELDPKNEVVQAQAALVFELLGQRSKALRAVGEALKHGYSRKEIEHDPYLVDLCQDPVYRLFSDGENRTDP